MKDSIVIVSAARTPLGSFQGDFSSLAAHDLGGVAIKAALERATQGSKLTADRVDELIFGNCLMAGQGQAPARQAGFKGGLPKSTGAVTMSKMCGSAMRATMFANDMLLAGSADVLISGGMESMTNAPYLLQKARAGYRIGHDRIFDHMMLDGLEDAYEAGRSMGTFGEECAAKYGFTRAQQDAFATTSVQRAQAATKSGAFAAEIAPVTVKGRAGDTVISIDQGPGKVKLDKITSLKPAFKKDGTITAASSSSINDGAATLMLMRASTAAQLGCKPLARIVSHAVHAQEPNWFTTAPIDRGGGEPVGFLRMHGVADDARQGFAAELGRRGSAHQHQRGRAVVDAGTAGSRDGAVFLEGRFEAGNLVELDLARALV